MHWARWTLSDRLDGLQLDDHQFLDQQVHRIVTDDDPIVHHGDAALLRNREAGFAKRMHEGVFVYLLKKSSSKSIGDSQGTADDLVRQMVQHGFIGVHRRLKIPCMIRTSTMGWTTFVNGRLLALAAEQCDVFVTVDRNLSFQQNLAAVSLRYLGKCVEVTVMDAA